MLPRSAGLGTARRGGPHRDAVGRRGRRWSAIGSAAALAMAVLVVGPTAPPAAAATGSVTGTVFRDYSFNGVYEPDGTYNGGARDVGVEGVTVVAFDATGAQVGTAESGADGSYSLTYDAAGDGTDVRLEFSTPDGFVPTGAGEDNGSSVQFVADGDVADYGFAEPSDFNGADTQLATAKQRSVINTDGSRTSTDLGTVVTFGAEQFTQTGENGTSQATVAQTGSVWGIATIDDEYIFSSALFKRASAVGPGGLGQVYLTETGGVPDATPFVTIPDAGQNPRPAGAADPGSGYDWFHDSIAYPEVGTIGLGAITLSPDYSTLYVVNLNDKQLYLVPITRDADGAPVAGTPTAEPIPAAPGCAAAWSRPFGVHATEENVFVGTTCTGPTDDDLTGYVLQRGVSDSAFSTEPVLTVPYSGVQRGIAITGISANAIPWGGAETFDLRNGWAMPQLVLSSIDFDASGAMLVGIKDRGGDQGGYYQGSPDESDPKRYETVAAGDILRACGSLDEGFVLEDNGSCGGVAGFGVGNGEGHGGGEFYYDNYRSTGHNQTGLGAVLQLPGRDRLVTTAYDPTDRYRTSGVRRDSNLDGSGPIGWNLQLVDHADPSGGNPGGGFGKAGGLGDLDALAMAPVEIGNRVWLDADDDGIQDPGESPVEGVAVDLTCDSASASTTTDAAGEYYFNDENVEGGLEPGVDCEITFDPSGTDADGLPMTQTDAGGKDTVDSDATGVDGVPTIQATTPAAGADHSFDVGFVDQGECRLGDLVWEDTDGNGVQDAEEPGVEGVTVELLDADGNVVETTTTDADGLYEFVGIECATYTVRFSDIPADSSFTTPNEGDDDAVDSDPTPTPDDPTVGVSDPVELTPDSPDDPTVDAGIVPAAEVCSLGDLVWLDENANGVQDDGEAGVEGVTVELVDADGNVVETTTTDADGAYEFAGIECGEYTVRFSDIPADSDFTSPNEGDDDAVDSDPTPTGDDPAVGVTDPVTLGGEEPNDNPTVDAGIVPPAEVCSLGDLVFEDPNGNGVRDVGEPGVEGVTVELLDADGNVVETTTTDADGLYEFVGIECATYTVRFSGIPEGSEFSPPNEGDDDAVDSDPTPSPDDPSIGVSDPVELTPDSPDDPTVDAGIVPAAEVCSLGDLVWLDENANGVQDDGEPGVEGVTVELLDADGNVVETTTTDADGLYEFVGIECATYTVRFSDIPADSEFTTPNEGDDDAVDSDPTPTPDDPTVGVSDPVELTPESPDDPTVDAGIVPAAEVCSLGDLVWLDENGNGVQDAEEPGVEGVTVELVDADGNVVETTTTDADALYEFVGIECATYTVRFSDIPADSSFTTPNEGDDDAVDSDPTPTGDDPAVGVTDPVMLGGEEPSDNPTVDAGILPPPTPGECSLGDLVFEDTNGNGVQDVDEPGVEGVTVELVDADGNVVETTTTDADGAYEFAGIECATYTVRFSDIPDGSEFSPPDEGGDDAVDSDPTPTGDDPTVGVTDPVELTPDDPDDPTVDAGIVPAAEVCSLGDLVFEDTNGNGIQDVDEPGVEGVMVELLDADGTVVDSTTTDADGLYEFVGIECATYTVRFSDIPEGSEFTSPNEGEDDAVDSDPTPTGDDPGVGVTDPVELTPDSPDDPTVDAGIVPAAEVCSLGDLVWLDENANGVQDDGEPGVEGVTVTLLDQDGNPVEGVEPVTTDENGEYLFEGIGCGVYVVEFSEIPADSEFTDPNAGDDDAVDSDPTPTGDDPTVGITGPVELTPESPDDPTVDAGIVSPAPQEVCSVRGIVWDDANGNGRRGDGESGIGGVTVELIDADGNVVATTVTGSKGRYGFTDIECGRYQIGVPEVPDGMEPTDPRVGSDDRRDSDLEPGTGLTDPFEVTPENPEVRHIDTGLRISEVNDPSGDQPGEEDDQSGGLEGVLPDTGGPGTRLALAGFLVLLLGMGTAASARLRRH